MNCYIDSSIVLRRFFGEVSPLKEWKSIKQGFSSRIMKLECLRTIDRLHIRSRISDEEAASGLAAFYDLISNVGLLPVTDAVMKRAEQAMPVTLATLDSIHLVTAIFWREKQGGDFVFATHDAELALAAKAHGFEVIGVEKSLPCRRPPS